MEEHIRRGRSRRDLKESERVSLININSINKDNNYIASCFEIMLTCYDVGCERLTSILHQDVRQTKPRTTKGRRTAYVKKYKVSDLYKRQERSNKQKRSVRESADEHIDEAPSGSQPRRRRGTTPAELAILKTLEAYSNDQPPDDVIEEICQRLGVEWDHRRTVVWWRNNVRKKLFVKP